MLRWLTKRLGIVRASKYTAVAKQLRRLEEQLAKQAERMEHARTWKAKAVDAERATADANADMAKEREHFERVIGDLERQTQQLTTELETLRRERKRQTNLEAVQKQLADAERELKVVREYVMLLEVKLDVLEGAANVLDSRTRSLMLRRVTVESGAVAARDGLERRLIADHSVDTQNRQLIDASKPAIN